VKIAILTTDNREHYKDYGAPGPYFGAAPEALLEGFAGLPEVEVHVISCLRETVGSPEKLAPNIYYHSLRVPRFGWMSSVYQGCVRAIRKKLKAIRPDIVHGQGSEKECALSAVLSGFPNVVTIHGNMAELARFFGARVGSFAWLVARLEDFSLKRTAGVFCNSEYTEGLVRSRARRVWRVPNAIREAYFAPRTTSRPPCCTLVNVGQISPRKRQIEMLDMAAGLRRLGLDFQFEFIGYATPGNPYAEAFRQKIKPMEAEGYAQFLGMKSMAEVIQCFDGSSAMVHFPSEESFGLVVAEALARDLKLFGARLGGILDISQGVAEVELFGADDWNGLSAAVASWIRRGAPPAQAAAPIIRQRYHPKVVAQRHLEIYREVLGRERH
jgi:glycosyltransferase involved in cell wall biosynthesis